MLGLTMSISGPDHQTADSLLSESVLCKHSSSILQASVSESLKHPTFKNLKPARNFSTLIITDNFFFPVAYKHLVLLLPQKSPKYFCPLVTTTIICFLLDDSEHLYLLPFACNTPPPEFQMVDILVFTSYLIACLLTGFPQPINLKVFPHCLISKYYYLFSSKHDCLVILFLFCVRIFFLMSVHFSNKMLSSLFQR